jgi:hypothetical protein
MIFEKRLGAVRRKASAAGGEEIQAVEEAVRDYRKTGDAKYSAYALADALAAYEKGLSVVDR